ncbi:PAS sensor protein [Desulfurivibrio alkaliphilus AHT 2]|uniref:PAS sensor protein n=2 Tax=Desulfurivibrio alkaliphilus TaxID=427923 RepID=D6Z1A0_DESAT|nr:PAS sensor protein [Desulfurivibrio alkaliphilus AHT 2]
MPVYSNKIFITLLFLLVLLSIPVREVLAQSRQTEILAAADPSLSEQLIQATRENIFGYELFENHGSVMLLIDPRSGDILSANRVARQYYGHHDLTNMKIQQINILSPEQVVAEMRRAESLNRNYFNFRHQLADGAIRDVEVYSYPVFFYETKLLFSLVVDVTDRLLAETMVRQKERTARWVMGGLLFFAVISVGLLWLIVMRQKRHQQILQAKNRQLEKARDEIKILRGIIPICSFCKKIRDEQGAWSKLEQYISRHSEALFSHGICPDCMEEHYLE